MTICNLSESCLHSHYFSHFTKNQGKILARSVVIPQTFFVSDLRMQKLNARRILYFLSLTIHSNGSQPTATIQDQRTPPFPGQMSPSSLFSHFPENTSVCSHYCQILEPGILLSHRQALWALGPQLRQDQSWRWSVMAPRTLSVNAKPALNLSCSAQSFYVSSQRYGWHKNHTRQCV